MQHPHLSVIMPAYNEGDALFANLHVVAAECRKLETDFEVLVVDDGSSDNTADEAMRAALLIPQVHVISYTPNRGKGHAVLTGARLAEGDLVAFIDSDLDIHPAQLGTALRVQAETNADVVIGSKWHPDSVVFFPAFRRFVSFCYYTLVRILFSLPVRDTQTGIKLYRRSLIERLAECVTSTGYAFDLEMLALTHHWGCGIAEMPVVVESQRVRSRIHLRDVFWVSVDTFKVFWRLTTGNRQWSAELGEETVEAKAGRS